MPLLVKESGSVPNPDHKYEMYDKKSLFQKGPTREPISVKRSTLFHSKRLTPHNVATHVHQIKPKGHSTIT
jgi:hypothetical protein